MKKFTVLLFALVVLSAQGFAAQLYRWVDDKGNVEWRDTPPPATARKIEQRNIRDNTIDTAEVPYSLQQAAKNFPVTLWLTNCGQTCDKARAHLNRRGVPYTEKNPQSDVAAFKKASGGSLEVPLLFVGSQKLSGYRESDWDAALDSAGYPKTALVRVQPPAKPSATAGAKPPASQVASPGPAPATGEPGPSATGPGAAPAPVPPAGTTGGNPPPAR